MPATKTKYRFKSNTPSGRMLADLYDGEEMDADRVMLILSLVMNRAPSIKTIRAWTDEQRHHAANWAMREYMRASDNPTVCLLKPDFIADEAPKKNKCINWPHNHKANGCG